MCYELSDEEKAQRSSTRSKSAYKGLTQMVETWQMALYTQKNDL